MQSLPLFHRVSGQPVLVLGEGAAADAKRRLAERAGAEILSDADDAIARHVRIAFVAIDDANEAKVAAERLRAAGMLVNVVDRPELCDFTTPSILERDPVLVAIGTGGASAGLAKHLRLRLEALLPSGVGRLASALAASRAAIRAKWPDAATRRRVLDEALGAGGALDPLSGTGPDDLARWLAEGRAGQLQSRRVELKVPADPSDLTLGQLQLLGSADIILFEPDVPQAILLKARADADRRPLEGAMIDDPPGLTLVLSCQPPAR